MKTTLETEGISADSNRTSFLLLNVVLEGLICSGSTKSGKPTYALLSERVPKTKSISKDKAFATLATKYFNSHHPATLHDFTWWSGLSSTDAKNAQVTGSWKRMIKKDRVIIQPEQFNPLDTDDKG